MRKRSRHVLLFDGTWNEPKHRTNIQKIKDSLLQETADGWLQKEKYWAGLGTEFGEWVRGGAFAEGLSENVREGYEYLRKEYEPGDEIFIFGFSRGAFTAAALVGFCYWCGLLTPSNRLSVEELFERYKNARLADYESGRDDLLSLSDLKERLEDGKQLSPSSLELMQATRVVRIKFLGLFDNVRSAGLEGLLPWLWRAKVGSREPEPSLKQRGTLVFRHTRHVPEIVDNAYHAMAIDEYRAAFPERVWIVPRGKKGDGSDAYVPEHAEQRWFAGAHGNVGGGENDCGLHLIPLRWMQEKASKAGLVFSELVEPPANLKSEQIADTYERFLWGLYKRFICKYYRFVSAKRIGNDYDYPVIIFECLHETIDESVFRLILKDKNYKPIHLRWALESIASSDGKHSQLAKDALRALIFSR